MPPAELLQFRIPFALPLARGLACLGWTSSAAACIERVTLFLDDGRSLTLDHGSEQLQVLYTPAPQQGDGSTPAGTGFMLWLHPHLLSKGIPMLTLNDQVAELDRPPLATTQQLLQDDKLVTAYGPTLLALARQQKDQPLQQALRPRLQQLREARSQQLGRVDQAWLLHDAGQLLLSGRLNCAPRQVTRAVLQSGKQQRDVTHQLLRSALATAWDSKGRPQQAEACAFALLLDADELRAPKAGAKAGSWHQPLRLSIETQSLAGLTVALHPLPGTVDNMDEILALAPAMAPALLAGLHARRPRANKASTAALQQAARTSFQQQWQHAKESTGFANLCQLTLDKACALHEAGLLLLGSFVRPASLSCTLWLHAEGHAPVDVTTRLQFLPVYKNLERLRKHYPQASEQLFFILHVALPTHSGQRRMLRLQVPGLPDLWLKVQTPQPQLRGVDEVKAVLAELPHSDYLWRHFKQVCDSGLGRALHWLGQPSQARSTPTVEQFGTPPRKPTVSIIVPLYGRWDFLRHQLAQFCKDPDFAQADLIYVVDDPSIHAAALADASHYQPLFGIPFRVLTYPENRGFAGANNSAVPFARAPLLLLLNSDVLPQQPGWLSTLRRAYSRLPQCGMVAPLLQFPEGSVQHAGMAATRQSQVNELVFSHHPGKGCAWEGGDKPGEQPLLTGACLLLSKQDYQQAGGLDEDYLVGDFEDSDFSLRLRALGKRLYLVPAARLWHLERQSQALGSNATSVRDMLTLYNAWRYHSKIAAGLLPDPEQPLAKAGGSKRRKAGN